MCTKKQSLLKNKNNLQDFLVDQDFQLLKNFHQLHQFHREIQINSNL